MGGELQISLHPEPSLVSVLFSSLHPHQFLKFLFSCNLQYMGCLPRKLHQCDNVSTVDHVAPRVLPFWWMNTCSPVPSLWTSSPGIAASPVSSSSTIPAAPLSSSTPSSTSDASAGNLPSLSSILQAQIRTFWHVSKGARDCWAKVLHNCQVCITHDPSGLSSWSKHFMLVNVFWLAMLLAISYDGKSCSGWWSFALRDGLLLKCFLSGLRLWLTVSLSLGMVWLLELPPLFRVAMIEEPDLLLKGACIPIKDIQALSSEGLALPHLLKSFW